MAGAAVSGAGLLQGASKLPIRKGVLVSMLPRNMSFAERFALAKECGFESLESNTVNNPAEAEELKKAADKAGLPVHGVMNSDHWQFPLSSPDPAVVDRSVKGMMASLDNAVLWGSQTVLLVPGVVNAEVGYEQAWKRSSEVIRQRLLPKYAEKKIIIAVENVWNKFLLSPMEMAQYVDSFKSPYVQAYFDVGNVALYGFSQDWIRTLGKRIVRVHLKDFSNRRNPDIKKSVLDWPNLMDGDLNWKAIHAALADIGYKGDATVELSGGDAAYLKDLSQRVDKILAGV
jgi:hexulose-6-phosphate isomerase